MTCTLHSYNDTERSLRVVMSSRLTINIDQPPVQNKSAKALGRDGLCEADSTIIIIVTLVEIRCP